MPSILAAQNTLTLVLTLVLFVIKAFAFVDAAIRPSQAFVAASKQTKPFWMLLLGLAVVANFLMMASPLGIFNVIGIVIALVYLADARPAVKSGSRR
ncbi:MAG: DUF2516 family protein [Nocardioidaceae bacterium]